MTAYEELLEEWRAKFDLWPWMESFNRAFPSKAQPGTDVFPSDQPSYDVLWPVMPVSVWDFWDDERLDGPGFADLSFGYDNTYLWQLGGGLNLIQVAQNSLVTENLIGSYNDRWLSLPKGARLPASQLFGGKFTLGSQYNGGNGLKGDGLVIQSLRGYRPYPKGTIQPLQRSREEIIESGEYILRSYTYGLQVTCRLSPGKVNSAASVQVQLNAPANLSADFLCHRIRFRPRTLLAPTTDDAAETGIQAFLNAIQVGVQDARNGLSFQGGQSGPGNNSPLTPWLHWLGVDYAAVVAAPTTGIAIQRLETQWVLPQPLTISNNALYNISAQGPALPASLYDLEYDVTMELALDGELIIPQGQV